MGAIGSLITIFIVILIGIFCEKKQIFDHAQREGFELLLIKLVLPCYLFIAAYQNDLNLLLDMEYIAAYLLMFIIMSVIVAFAFVGKIDNPGVAIRMLCSGYVNAGIYTLPIITILLQNPTAAIIGNMIQVVIIQPLFIIYFNIALNKNKALYKKILHIVTTPITIAPILGILLNYLNIAIPMPLSNAASQIGYGASGLALFSFGMIIGATKLTKNCLKFDLLSVIFAKNIMHPIIALFVGYCMKLEPYWFTSLLIASSSPTAFVIYMIAKQFKTDQALAQKVIAISSSVSIVSLIFIAIFIA